MTETPDSFDAKTSGHGMTRRQLARRAGWFGSAIVLTVAGGEVISHIAGSRDASAAAASSVSDANTLRFVRAGRA